MLLQIGIAHNGCDESGSVLYAQAVCLGVGTVQSQVEMEIGEFLLQSEEVFQEEHFVDGTGTIEIVHLAVAALTGLEHVHNLRTQGSHTGTTTYPNHLALRVVDGTELSVRTAHGYLVTGLQAEDVT